ncbi:GON-4-like protein isoform X2 [Hoplias malabaricus]|uniref:GON-4-like protein isoform X2 n=1 Tax=Hoplias malabaricus TaxID=27720 RepID=UPI003462A47D
MKTDRRRKSSSPEPQTLPSKVVRKDSVSGSHGDYKLTLTPGEKISTPTKRKTPNTSSPRRHSPRFKCHGQKPGCSEHGNDSVHSSSSPESPTSHSEEDTELGLVITLDEERDEKPDPLRRKSGGKPKKGILTNNDISKADKESADEGEDSEEEFKKLDRDLAVKSKQHNLTSVNVRNIIHEVITNEHVVAMMKAAIRETQDMPMFEPKMTRSKLKEVFEKGEGIPTWNISPIKKSNEIKPPQFVDIPLEDEEDSSDEEYHPDEDEEDETAEETILESDMDSIASSPRISRRGRSRTPIEFSECDEERSSSPRLKSRLSRHLRVEAVPMGPPAPPSQSSGSSRPQKVLDSFMEKLHAVDEELELNPLSMEPYQTLTSSENAGESLVACRTRSKRPLRDIPLNQLEAELRAPDITPDMYKCVSAQEDKEWSHWLQGLMTSHLENEEECDDEDDPEYNFLDDLDEPDLEDYRNDRAVRITKKEVNELMDELFETFQDELSVNEQDEEDHEERSPQGSAKFNVPQAIRFEEPLAHMLTACRRTVREQLDALQQRKEQQNRPNQATSRPTVVLIPPPCTLVLTPTQKWQLQQQIQQHVQLLTQVNMLCSSVETLQSQASTTKLFLTELQSFAERAEQVRAEVNPGFRSMFRVCNLQPSLHLLEELKHMLLTHKTATKVTKSHAVRPYPLLPAPLAWLFATRSVFLYPELLPHCSLDPAIQPPRCKNLYTKGEDGLIVLGLKHFSETEFPYHLMSQYLIWPKTMEQLRVRVKDMCSSRAADNVIKRYSQNHVVPLLPVFCKPVVPGEERPPVEREKNIMPNWLRKSLPNIHKAVFGSQSEERSESDNQNLNDSPPLIFPEGTPYPQCLPKGVTLQLYPSARRQSSARPHKPRPLHGFAQPALTPLAKAPPCPSGTVSLLTNVPAPLSSQGVILLSQAPCIQVNGTVPVSQVASTPAHGTVPLSSVGPVNFQYVVPQPGCVNPVESLASLPPAVACNTPVTSNKVVTTRVIQSVLKKAEMPKKRYVPRKVLPIQPPPLNPGPQLTRLVPLTPGAAVSANLGATAQAVKQATDANFAENITNASPSMVVIQSSSLLDVAAVHPAVTTQGWVKSTNTPSLKDSTTQAISSHTQLATLSTHSVRMQSQDCPKESAENEIKWNTNPVIFTHMTCPPLEALENINSSPALQAMDQQKHPWHNPVLNRVNGEVVCDKQVMHHHCTLDNKPSTTNIVSISKLPQNSSTGVSPSASSLYNISSCTGLSAVNSQYVLVQAALQADTPQFLLVPKNSLIPSHPVLNATEGENSMSQQHTTFSDAVHTSDVPRNLPTNVALPSEGEAAHVTSSPCADNVSSEVWKEEMEVGAEVGGEEMAGALFGSPFLTLSESSSVSDSCLNSSSVDSRTNVMLKDSKYGPSPKEGDNELGKNYEKGSTAVPGMFTLTSGAENQKPAGKEGHSDGAKREEDEREGQQNGEKGGGEERDGGEEGEKRGGGDGRRQGNGGGGDKNDEEKDGDGEREEEEEDFDELTQDEDEEEVMSSASEESVLSVPELQETMEKLTWLASERRLCGEGDSEEDNSPNSPTSQTSPTSPISQNSQEENSEDEEDGAIKGEELEPTEGEGGKLPEGDTPQEDDPPQTSGKGAGRGRGRGRPPPRSLKRSRRQERCSKDTSKLLLLYDDHILENDPMRESKDIAFAQAYLNRVREAMQDTPGKMEEFLSLLYEFEQGGETCSVVELFSQLKPLLKDWPELLSDFAAFLLPEQALECGLFEEQQAFERSRRFLRQLEISFGENPSHYQKIVRALQAGSALTAAGIDELKAQMATLLKGHTHLQGEFSIFFDELRPPPARPGQFEEAIWPEDTGSGPEGGDGAVSLVIGGGMSGGFEEVTLPDLEEEDETNKIPQITGRSKRRKELSTHRNYKDCDWPEKDCPCHCHESRHEAKHRRHKRKVCQSCHGNKGTDGSKALKSGDSSFPTADPLPERGEERGGEEEKDTEMGVKDESGSLANSPHHDPEGQTWEGSEGEHPPNPEERDDEEEEEEEEEEWKESDGKHCSSPSKLSRDEEGAAAEQSDPSPIPISGERDMLQQSPSSDTTVCAKNISLTPSGERVVLWTREADRVILTACQQQGANQSTFQAVSVQLGNKTPSEVSKRFRDLMRLFHTSARQASSEDEGAEHQSATDEEQD